MNAVSWARNHSRFFLLACAMAACASAGGASAQELDIDALAKRPDLQVTRKMSNGEEVVEIRKATVVITKTKAGVVGVDSGTAILCAWRIYVDLKIAADVCFPDSEAELKRDLGSAVDRLKDFIITNSLTPVSRASLETSVQRRQDEILARLEKMPKAAGGKLQCPQRDWLADFQADGRAKRRADVDKILAVPRPPVADPCL